MGVARLYVKQLTIPARSPRAPHGTRPHRPLGRGGRSRYGATASDDWTLSVPAPEQYSASIESRADAVAKTWTDYWETSNMRRDFSFRGRLLRRYIAAVGGMSSRRYTLGILKRVLGDVAGKDGPRRWLGNGFELTRDRHVMRRGGGGQRRGPVLP